MCFWKLLNWYEELHWFFAFEEQNLMKRTYMRVIFNDTKIEIIAPILAKVRNTQKASTYVWGFIAKRVDKSLVVEPLSIYCILYYQSSDVRLFLHSSTNMSVGYLVLYIPVLWDIWDSLDLSQRWSYLVPQDYDEGWDCISSLERLILGWNREIRGFYISAKSGSLLYPEWIIIWRLTFNIIHKSKVQ